MHERRSSGGGLGVLAILIALGLIIGAVATPFITGLSQIILVGFGALLLLIGGFVVTITRLYVKTSSDASFVRTGAGGSKVISDGGALVIPVVHNIVWVTHNTMRLDVERQGENALITGDNLRADVKSEFYIRVKKTREDILSAATSLGHRLTNPEQVKELVNDKLVNALRTVAATQNLNNLHTKRNEFAEAVQKIVEQDLSHNGLTLESVTISRLDQTPLTAMKAESNVFDAQGARTIAEIVNTQKVLRNQIERTADQEIKKQDVGRDQFVYEQEVARAKAEADKNASIQQAQAEAAQHAATFAAEQEKLSGIAAVQKEQAINVAEVEKAKVIQVADQQREQATQTAEVEKAKAVELAEREKAIAVADAEKRRAKAEAERFAAEKAREAEKQSVLTVEVTQTAERDKAKAVIAKQATIDQERLQKQMEADVEAYTRVTEAEGEKGAAEKQAHARRTLAEADRDAKTLEAEGDQAVQMVPVTVSREQVTVESARVDVLRKELESKAAFENVAIELQVKLAQIEAEKQAKIAAAHAYGEAMAKANVTIWGDPTTMARMSEGFYRGQANGKFVEGLAASMPDGVKTAAESLATGIGQMGAALIHKMTGKRVSPDEVETAIKDVVGSRS